MKFSILSRISWNKISPIDQYIDPCREGYKCLSELYLGRECVMESGNGLLVDTIFQLRHLGIPNHKLTDPDCLIKPRHISIKPSNIELFNIRKLQIGET